MSTDSDLSLSKSDMSASLSKLISKRLKMAFGLSLFLLVLYTIYSSLLGVDVSISSQKISGNVNLIVFVSLFVVVAGVAVAGIYTWWANTILDPQLKEMREKYDAE